MKFIRIEGENAEMLNIKEGIYVEEQLERIIYQAKLEIPQLEDIETQLREMEDEEHPVMGLFKFSSKRIKRMEIPDPLYGRRICLPKEESPLLEIMDAPLHGDNLPEPMRARWELWEPLGWVKGTNELFYRKVEQEKKKETGKIRAREWRPTDIPDMTLEQLEEMRRVLGLN